ncbi:hypothetical protein SFC65_19830 [Priestia filamentosa]|uniref:hypothetical protein n=1 Tax=Priestia filamentosa TaxID=1402861 RepID=UPI003982C572
MSKKIFARNTIIIVLIVILAVGILPNYLHIGDPMYFIVIPVAAWFGVSKNNWLLNFLSMILGMIIGFILLEMFNLL